MAWENRQCVHYKCTMYYNIYYNNTCYYFFYRVATSKLSTEAAAAVKTEDKKPLTTKMVGIASRTAGTVKPAVSTIRKTTTITKKPEDKVDY